MPVKLAYHANCWGPLGGNAVGVTSITPAHLPHLRRHGAGDPRDRRGRLRGHRALRRQPARLRRPLRRACAALSKQSGVAAGRRLFRRQFHLRRHPRRGTGAHRARRGALRRNSAPSISSSAAAPSAPTGRERDDIKRLGAALEKVVRHRPEARACRALPSAPVDDRRGPGGGRARSSRETSINFCPDTAHLAAAGGDVPALIREHRDRITYVHLKGWQQEPFAFTPLDCGDLDMTRDRRGAAAISASPAGSPTSSTPGPTRRKAPSAACASCGST